MADSTPKSYHTDPTLYLYTSLTAGSSQIITATSRLETILKANRIPFQALDVATDEKARMLWGRRAGKRKLPGLVRMGMLVGDLEEIEEWNEYGELKEKVGGPMNKSESSVTSTPTKMPQSASMSSKLSTTDAPSDQASSSENISQSTTSSKTESPMAAAMRQAGMEAAKKAGDAKAKVLAKAGVSSKLPSEAEKELVNDDSKIDPQASPEKDVYEGQGSNDPDKEAVVPDSKDTIPLEGEEKAGAGTEEERGAEGSGRNTIETTTKATAASDEAQDLPGKRTQDQASADATEAGASVAD
ncbi:MAG: hypothetical protein Q9219_003455 [cf. Caloplaca sp. 3 TL-2023]